MVELNTISLVFLIAGLLGLGFVLGLSVAFLFLQWVTKQRRKVVPDLMEERREDGPLPQD